MIAIVKLFGQASLVLACVCALQGCGGGGTTTPGPTAPPAPSPGPAPDPADQCPQPLQSQSRTGTLAAGQHSSTEAMSYGHSVGWTKVRRVSPDVGHELLFAVRQKNLDKVEQMLRERSDPKSALYGEWLSGKEVRELTMNAEAVEALKKILKEAGAEVKATTLGGELVRAKASIQVWEELLQAEFHVYESKFQTKLEHVAAERYTLPINLHDHAEAILGCLEFPGTSNAPKKSLKLKSGAGGMLNPDMIRKAYNMPDVAAAYSPEANSRENTTQAAYASLGQMRSTSDRQAFQKMYNLPDRAVTELDDGSHTSETKPGVEAMLDVEYMIAMSPWSKMGFWYFDLAADKGSFVDFIEAVLQRPSPPEVISVSYGGFESQHPESVIKVFNDNAKKLGVQGVTILAATGDDGAQGGLWNNKDANCAATKIKGLQVNWPASSPYITAVGATMGIESGTTEKTCQIKCQEGYEGCRLGVKDNQYVGPLITSGGGYSQYPQPDWQKNANLVCNTRGIPDVSLAGHSYNIIVGGKQEGVDGTSASSPTFAGMVSLVNARRKSTGQPTVGFINPTLYATSSAGAFNDITSGDNKCGGVNSAIRNPAGYIEVNCCGGWEAKKGWDAATGLGSIDFQAFENIFPNKTKRVEQVVV